MEQSLKFITFKVIIDKETCDNEDFLVDLLDMDFSEGTDHWKEIKIVTCQPVFRELAEYIVYQVKNLHHHELKNLETLLNTLREIETYYKQNFLVKFFSEDYKGKLKELSVNELENIISERLRNSFNISCIDNNKRNNKEIDLILEFVTEHKEEFIKFLIDKGIDVIQ